MDRSHIKGKEELPESIFSGDEEGKHLPGQGRHQLLQPFPEHVESVPWSTLFFSLRLNSSLYHVFCSKKVTGEEEGKISPEGNSDHCVWCPQSRSRWKVLSHWTGMEKSRIDHADQSLGQWSALALQVWYITSCALFPFFVSGLLFWQWCPNKIRKQSHNAPNFLNLTLNGIRHCGEQFPGHGKVVYYLHYNIF